MRISKDRLTPEQRSRNMSRIRGKDTKPEKIVRSLLHKMGYRFRLHRRIVIPPEVRGQKSAVRHRPSVLRRPPSALRPLIIRPDIVLPKYKTAIFVHGCFWHRHKGCKNCTTPTHQREFWLNKFEGNAARDKLHQRALRKLGWRVIVVWECETDRRDVVMSLRKVFLNLW